MGPFARASAATTPEGGIPGLPGSPVRTPVRPAGGRSSGPELWPALAGRLLTRQLWIELYGLPGYALTLAGPRIPGFAATPRDFRPVEAGLGRALLGGRFTLAGVSLDVEGGDPWNRPSPSRAFAVELHAFAWLPSLMQEGERGATAALRLTLAWADLFSRWSPFAWDPEIMARRVMALSCAARRMTQGATDDEKARLADTLHRQARQLLRPPGGVATKAQRLVAAATAGCVLTGGPGGALRAKALSRLPRSLDATIGADGGHASRAPEAGLELLLDLLTLDDALAQLSEATPAPVAAAMHRLTVGLRRLTLPDGRLAAFQGGGPSTVARVAAARAHDEPGETGHQDVAGVVGGLIRIRSPLLTIVADGGAPAKGGWGAAACAQPGALEIVCGRDRLITGSGWTARAADRQGLRLTPAASTLTLGEQSIAEPLGGARADLLGPRLIGPPVTVTTEQRDGEGAVWLEIAHDGWTAPFGLTHQRRLYLDQRLDELRAEERLFPTPDRKDVVRQIAAPYAIRFHLEPGVQASLARDRRSILLRGASGRGWWFRTDGPDVAIEPSVHIDEGLTRRSLQIVVRGSARTDNETKIRWKLSPAGASGDPA